MTVSSPATKTSLEYAHLDFFLDDNVTVVAGKVLLPLGVLGERLHTTWINQVGKVSSLKGRQSPMT